MADRDDAPFSGGWEEWGRLVLDTQKRLSHDLRELTNKVGNLANATDVKRLEDRVSAAESKLEAALDRIDTYRKTIAAVSLTLAAVILLPIVRAWVTTKGGGGP